MHEAVQDSVLRVAERNGSSSVHERLDCADPVQPRFRRVEHAFGCLGRYHGVERREEERTESGHGHGGTDGTSARHRDRSSRATGSGKGSIGTEGRYHTKGRDTESCPCHDGTRGEYRSDRETSRTGTREEYRITVKPPEQVEKEKGLETEKRESEVSKDLPEPEIPEKPFEATSDQEVTFRMKAWSNWLHRQDQKDEEKRIKNRARQRALRQQRRSDRAAGLQQAARKGPSLYGGRGLCQEKTRSREDRSGEC